jgi:hypothetical protein
MVVDNAIEVYAERSSHSLGVGFVDAHGEGISN